MEISEESSSSNTVSSSTNRIAPVRKLLYSRLYQSFFYFDIAFTSRCDRHHYSLCSTSTPPALLSTSCPTPSTSSCTFHHLFLFLILITIVAQLSTGFCTKFPSSSKSISADDTLPNTAQTPGQLQSNRPIRLSRVFVPGEQ